MENWSTSPHYPGYRVSSLGRIFSEKRGKMLKPRVTPTGYYIVDLPVEDSPDKKKYKSFYIHRLVADTHVFNSNPQKNTSVIFLDGDRENIICSNLKWVPKDQARSYGFSLVDELKTIKKSLSAGDLELSPGMAPMASIRDKRLWYRYNGVYYRVRSTNSSLGFYILEKKSWKFVTIASLILEKTTGPRPGPGYRVGYRDWDIYNLSPLNLLWETTSEKLLRHNRFDPIGRLKKISLEHANQKKIKISPQELKQMIELRSYGRTLRKLAKLYNISPATVSRYIRKWEKSQDTGEAGS